MKPRCAAALALVGWYLMVPSPSRAAGGSPGSVDVKAARIYAASENSEAPGAQGSDDSQLRGEIENEWYVMCPPFTTKPLGIDASAPFTQWRLATHWLNRDECEKNRAGAAQIAAHSLATSDKETLRVAATELQHCRCFSSNDPLLDQKFVRKSKDFYLEQLYHEGLLKRPPK